MKTILSFTALLLLLTMPALAANPDNIPGVEVVEIDAEGLAELGINLDGAKITYTEPRIVPGSEPQDTIYKKIVIDDRNISFRNAGEELPAKAFNPRYVLRKMSYGTQSYFSRLDDYMTINILSRNESEEIHYYPGIDELVCVKPVLPEDAGYEVYLWFDPEVIAEEEKPDEEPVNDVEPPASSFGEVVVYPNPATGNFVSLRINFEQARRVDISIYEQSGAKLRDIATGRDLRAGDEIIRADISGLASGMYLIMISDADGNNIVKRLIVNK